MKKIIVISDKFKGTISSMEICSIAEQCIRQNFPGCEVIAVPVADGGEGTVDCFAAVCDGEKVTVTVNDSYNQPISASYLKLNNGAAVIEMASSSGLPQVGDNKNPSKTSTYGVGQQIKHAVESGCRQIFVGLGGSSTNDGGCGCASALGVDFYDENGNTFVPVGGTLDKIKRIDITRCREFLKDVKITAMCDIDNPMHGERGSAYVFSPQKGADEEMVRFLDGQLKSLDRAIQDNLGLSVADVPGSGAAGAFGAGMLAFFGAELKSGIETVLDIVEFDRMLEGCDLVFTGEGKLDSQSLDGKVICGVAKRSKAHNVPVVVIAGTVDENVEESREFEDIGVSAVFSINRKAQAFEESKYHSKENYRYTMNNILRLLKIKGE